MLANINFRVLLLVIPVLIVTICHLTGNSIDLGKTDTDSAYYISPLLFAIACALIYQEDKRIWKILGSIVAFFISLSTLNVFVPDFRNSAVMASVIAPLVVTYVFPKFEDPDKITVIDLLNCFLAFIFMIVFCVILSIIGALVYKNFISGISFTFLSRNYDDAYSFLYGVLYQIGQTIGFGEDIIEILSIHPKLTSSRGFYAATALTYCAVLPGIYCALACWELQRRKFTFGILFVATLFSVGTGQSISFLLLILAWIYPSMYALYLILSILIYFVVRFFPFTLTVDPENFYQPNLSYDDLSQSSFSFYSSVALSVFAIAVTLTLFVIRADKNNKEKLLENRNQSAKATLSHEDVEKDESLAAITILKYLGGFNNVIWMSEEDSDVISVKIVTENMVNRDGLELAHVDIISFDKNTQILTIQPHSNIKEIREQIFIFAANIAIDIKTGYQDIAPYIIEESIFKDNFIKETPDALDTNKARDY